MSLNWNNVKPACCAKWLVLPTVYSDALSYGEQLDKFCYQLNQLIENNNILPDFIAEMIKEYINSGAIGEVVRDILADYILNVKYPPNGITPAVGDGSADDTEAIQGCIDYAAENGGVVYLPYGSYLTQPLTMKDGVSLFGFDRYSTKIVLKGGATKSLIGGTVADLSIANITLDGNSGIQVNDVNVVTIMGANVLLTNLIIKDGYMLVNYNGTGGHLQISDVVFGNAVEKCLLTAGNADVQCENVVFNQLSAVGGISVMDIGTDGGFFNVKSVATCNQCIVVTGNNNKISAIVENAAIPVVDNGLQNNIEIFGVSNKEFYSGNTTKDVNGSYSKHVGGAYTKAVDGNANDSVDGYYSQTVGGTTTKTYKDEIKNVSGNCSETIEGDCNKTVNGTGTENYNALNKTVTGKAIKNYASLTKTVTGEAVENYASLTKTVTGEAVENYASLTKTEVIEEKNIETDYNETIGKNKTVNVKGTSSLKAKNLIAEFENYSFYDNKKLFLCVNVKSFGAKGDGVTDDSDAIQAAVDTGMNVFFPFENGEVYIVSKTITVSKKWQCLYGNNFSWTYNDGFPCILSTANLTFNLVEEGQFLNGLSIVSKNTGTGTCVNMSWNVDSTDSGVLNCFIHGFNIAILYHGRHAKIKNNVFTEINYGVELHYTYDGSGGNTASQPTTGFRGVEISENKVHGCIEYFVHLIEGNVSSMMIQNNNIDIGNGLLRCDGGSVLRNTIISNNVVNNSNKYFILAETMLKCLITGNTSINSNDTYIKNGIAFIFTDNMDECVISSNICYYYVNDAINILLGGDNNIISSNYFSGTRRDGNSGGAFIKTSGVNGLVIVGNTFNDDSSNVVSVLRGNGNVPTFNKLKMIGNVYNCTKLITNYTNGTNNDIQTENV